MSRKSPSEATTTSFKITLATFVILLCSTVAGVVRYFESAKLEAAKNDYNSKLASINRKLVGGDYLNVKQFVIHRNDGTRPPANSKFYSDDFFYAPNLQTWT